MKKRSRTKRNQLYNIHQANEIHLFSHKLDRILSGQSPGCLVAMNIRKFKFINEIFGREFADQLLVDTKRIIKSLL